MSLVHLSHAAGADGRDDFVGSEFVSGVVLHALVAFSTSVAPGRLSVAKLPGPVALATNPGVTSPVRLK